ncbi:MAG: hypothetical protein ACK421_10125 [Pseudanabaenaceae cyanobacterium]
MTASCTPTGHWDNPEYWQRGEPLWMSEMGLGRGERNWWQKKS